MWLLLTDAMPYAPIASGFDEVSIVGAAEVAVVLCHKVISAPIQGIFHKQIQSKTRANSDMMLKRVNS